ncbi:MAG: hypothetical protein WCF23_05045 [Candidatus Nitrosopolaris sp.]
MEHKVHLLLWLNNSADEAGFPTDPKFRSAFGPREGDVIVFDNERVKIVFE